MFLPVAKAALVCRTRKELSAPAARWPPCNPQTYSRNPHFPAPDSQSAASPPQLTQQPASSLQFSATECFH